MKPSVLPACLWTIVFTFLFSWLVMYATAGALQPPASYVQSPAKCQVRPVPVGP